MNRAIGAFVILGSLAFANLRAPNTSMPENPQVAACGVIEEALKDVRQLKPGMTRREVEHKFELDGGAMPIDQNRYLYKKCGFIKVVIDFKLAHKFKPGQFPESSPDDVIIKVSKPDLELPDMD